jgi:CRISPR/Cas system Type II protein with McrA/HNH and RuvC-like nuclease domain
MFINICWKKDGQTKKSLMEINKATQMVQKLESQGIQTWFEADKLTI